MGVAEEKTPYALGLFGGTFDPPHNGHVAIVRFVLDAGIVDRVLVVPTGQPWLREDEPHASPRQRLEMARLAFSGIENAEVSDVEVERAGPTYTVDTIQQLRAGGVIQGRPLLILGEDSAQSLDRWHGIEELVGMCDLLVISRPGAPAANELPVDHPAWNARRVEGPMLEVSATEVRRRIAAGADVSDMSPPAVAAYVREHGIYTHEDSDQEKSTS